MLRTGRPAMWQTAPEESDALVIGLRSVFIIVFSIAANSSGHGFQLSPAWVGVTIAVVYTVAIAMIWWRRRAIPWQRPFSLLIDITMVSGVVATYGVAAAGVKDVYYFIIFAAAMWFHLAGAVVVGIVCLIAYIVAFSHGSGLSLTLANSLSIIYDSGAALMPLVGFVAGTFFRAYSQEVLRLAEISHEISLARRLQQNLLPPTPPRLPGWAIAAVMRPAREVGGDMYSFHQLSDGSMLAAVADMAGKSVYGLVHLSLIHSHLRAAAADSHCLAEIVNQLNRRAYDELQPDSYAAAVFIKLSPDAGRISFVNCGHLPPLLVRPGSGQPKLLATGDPIIGAQYDHDYTEATADVPPGGVVVCYTDGLVEARNSAGEMFGEQRLRRFVVRNAHLPPVQLCNALLDEVGQFTGGDMEDDQTVVVFRREAD